MSMLTFDDCPPILKSCKDDDFSRRSIAAIGLAGVGHRNREGCQDTNSLLKKKTWARSRVDPECRATARTRPSILTRWPIS